MPSSQAAHVTVDAKRRQDLSALIEKSAQQPGLKEALEVYTRWRKLDSVLQAHLHFNQTAGVITTVASVGTARVKR